MNKKFLRHIIYLRNIKKDMLNLAIRLNNSEFKVHLDRLDNMIDYLELEIKELIKK